MLNLKYTRATSILFSWAEIYNLPHKKTTDSNKIVINDKIIDLATINLSSLLSTDPKTSLPEIQKVFPKANISHVKPNKAKSTNYLMTCTRINAFAVVPHPNPQVLNSLIPIIKQESQKFFNYHKRNLQSYTITHDDLYTIGLMHACIFIYRYRFFDSVIDNANLRRYLTQEYGRFNKRTYKQIVRTVCVANGLPPEYLVAQPETETDMTQNTTRVHRRKQRTDMFYEKWNKLNKDTQKELLNQVIDNIYFDEPTKQTAQRWLRIHNANALRLPKE
jgi:hypothetical protein